MQSSPFTRGTETILVVEDDAQVRLLSTRILRSCGYHVLDAGSGPEAKAVVEAHEEPIHLLLTDVVMPQMSGREVADWVQARRPDTRVVFMSGYTDRAIVHHGVLESGIAFLAKPFTPTTLTAKVRAVLDERRGEAAS